MVKVVGIAFKKNGKVYNFLPNGLNLAVNDNVIVETERGLQFGVVMFPIKEVSDELVNSPLNNVISIASSSDIKKHSKNIADAKKALQKCRDLVEKYNLNMYIIDATYTHDRNQLFFRFMADNRVDFRLLAKDLANIFKTRIELRQIGVRDRAKEVGGYGQCGRPLCCSKFMNDFDSISINMAKTQNIALNPSKINGICGRLLCCLKYENECYKECSKGLPQVNKKIKTPQGEGRVVSVDVLKGIYKVNIPEVGIVEFQKDKNESN